MRRRPDKTSLSSAMVYLPCTECKAWILEASLSFHSRSCPAGKDPDRNVYRNSIMLISPWITCSDSDDAEIEEIMFKMKETAMNPGLKMACQKDRLIKEFCRGLLHKLGTNNEQRRKDKDNVRAKLRAVGRLLLSLNKKSEKE